MIFPLCDHAQPSHLAPAPCTLHLAPCTLHPTVMVSQLRKHSGVSRSCQRCSSDFTFCSTVPKVALNLDFLPQQKCRASRTASETSLERTSLIGQRTCLIQRRSENNLRSASAAYFVPFESRKTKLHNFADCATHMPPGWHSAVLVLPGGYMRTENGRNTGRFGFYGP